MRLPPPKDIDQWHRWFAWCPIADSDNGVGWTWLETVERRWNHGKYYVGDASGYVFESGGWDYRYCA
jgi:hypothetical protein